MPTFIFKSGGNGQTVKMSESISQSLTSTETSEVRDAVKSERHLCVSECVTVSLFVSVSHKREQEAYKEQIFTSASTNGLYF